MSFSNDFLSIFKLGDMAKEIVITFVIGVGVLVVGDVIIDDFLSDKIIISCGKRKYCFTGNEMFLMSLSKGEIVIRGDILSIFEVD